MLFWNSENSTYYDQGRRAYSRGDEIPDAVISQMGKETLDEYVEKGLIANKITKTEAETAERDALIAKAEIYGLKPHYKAGIGKLEAMIEEHLVMQSLKKEALELGIEVSDGMTFAELKPLVDEKRADEPDS